MNDNNTDTGNDLPKIRRDTKVLVDRTRLVCHAMRERFQAVFAKYPELAARALSPATDTDCEQELVR